MKNYIYTVAERLMKYVQIDTTANPNSTSNPSSEKQKDLSKLLCNELINLGINAETDEFGYVYATIPSNTKKKCTCNLFLFAC
jgi:tripeptide aminopeptidase